MFESILVLTRLVTHNDQPQFQVYRQPIPLPELVLEDLPDGEVRVGGSIRGAFTAANEKGTGALPDISSYGIQGRNVEASNLSISYTATYRNIGP